MGAFPLAAAAVAGVFAAALLRRYLTRRRAFQALWAVAMAMYALASLALFAGVVFGWNDFLFFRVYWLFGAVLNVPYLAGGEACLLFRSERTPAIVMSVLVMLTTVGVAMVFAASGRVDACCETGFPDLPSGSDVWRSDAGPLVVARVFSYAGYAFLLAGTLWSAFRMRGAAELRGRFWGTLLVALGATVVAGGSAFAATGVLAGFSLTLLAGISLMFLGFLKASGPSRDGRPAAQVS